MKKADATDTMPAAQRIDNQIAELSDWRGSLIARLRRLIHEAAPDITEEWKWGTAVWSQNGMVCSTGAFKDHVKLNFFQGAVLPDPRHLFNAGLEAKGTRGIDFHEDRILDEAGLKELIHAAVVYNQSGQKKK